MAKIEGALRTGTSLLGFGRNCWDFRHPPRLLGPAPAWAAPWIRLGPTCFRPLRTGLLPPLQASPSRFFSSPRPPSSRPSTRTPFSPSFPPTPFFEVLSFSPLLFQPSPIFGSRRPPHPSLLRSFPRFPHFRSFAATTATTQRTQALFSLSRRRCCPPCVLSDPISVGPVSSIRAFHQVVADIE